MPDAPTAEPIVRDCTRCGRTVAIPPDRELAFCPNCGMVAVEQPLDANGTLRPLDISRYAIERDEDALSIEWTWRSIANAGGPGASVLIGLLITLFLSGGVGLSVLLFEPDRGLSPAWETAIAAFTIGCLGVAAYLLAAVAMNRTSVHVDRDALTISHGPIPAGRPLSLPSGTLRQLFVQQNAPAASWDGHHTPASSFRLFAVTTDGRVRPLLSAERQAAPLRAIERLVETQIGLDDIPVQGEYR